MFNRSTLWILVAAFALAGLISGLVYFRQPVTASSASIKPALSAVQLMDAPRAIPPFSLQTATGAPFNNASLQGHWTLIFLGFTHCPDVCPTTLATMKPVQNGWQTRFPGANRPKLVFVSVDPLRDTPALAQRYASGFHADTLAATAPEADLLKFTQSLSMVFMRNPPDNAARPDQYSVDHSAAMAVVNPSGELAGFLKAPFNADAIAKDMDTLAGAAP